MKKFSPYYFLLLAVFTALTDSLAQEKLLVQFRSADACERYLTRLPNAHALVSRSTVSKSPLLQSTAVPQAVLGWLDSLQTFAVVFTTNPDSLQRLLRFDSTITRMWQPHRYRIEPSSVRVAPTPLQAQWYLDSLRAQQAWRLATGSGVIVGVIDTGIDWSHSVLASALWINAAEDNNRNGRYEPWSTTEQRDGLFGDLDGIDNDGNGFVDDVIGYSFVNQNPTSVGLSRGPIPYDQNGHGTATAALIAGRSPNDDGFRGIAYNARIMTLRAFDPTGTGDEDDIAAAVVYAVLNGAQVINCSFGDIVRSQLISSALSLAAAADVVVVASSGNSGSDLPHYPSDEPTVLSIGASTETGRPAVFSSYGERLFLLAPGQNLLSAAVGGDFVSVSGTSFAAPLVSGAVALLRSYNPSLNAEHVRTILAESASPLTGQWQRRTGHGIVAPLAALERSALIGRVCIHLPFHHSRFRQDSNVIECVFDAVHPLLTRWELVAQTRDTSVVIDSGSIAAVNYRLPISIHSLSRDSQVVIRLRAFLRTGKTIEDAVVVEFDAAQLQFQQTQALMAWLGNSRRLVIVAQANQTCEIAIEVLDHQGRHVATHRGDGQYRRLHSVVLPTIPSGIYAVQIRIWDDRDSATVVLDSVRVEEFATTRADWKQQPYTAEPLLLSGSTLVRAGTFVATRFAPPQDAVVIEHTNDTLRIATSSLYTRFLRGLGDVDGDGLREILTYDAGQSRLYRFDPVPFAQVLWGDTATSTFWAAALADVTGDRRPEILGFRTRRATRTQDGSIRPQSDALVIVGWNGASFRVLDSIELSSSTRGGRSINTISAPLCAVGDFDNDGRTEIAYADSDGDLEIAEWSNNRLAHEYTAPPQPFLAGAGTEFVLAADLDGNGTSEIFYAAPALPAYNTMGEYEPPLWHLVLLGSTAPNQYGIVWEDYVWGVRYGRPFYNGVAAGDLTGDGKPEIVATLFPYAYVLTWNQSQPSWLLVCDSVWSNGALIADLDGDGRSELGLTRGLVVPRTEFFAYAPNNLRAPAIVQAYATPTGDIFCRWVRADTADRFQLRVEETIVAETDDIALLIPASAVPGCSVCRIQVQSLRGNDSSNWSDPAVVVRGEPLSLTRVDTATAGDRMIRIYVRGALPAYGISPDALTIERDGQRWTVEYTATNGRTELVAWLNTPLGPGLYNVKLREGTSDEHGNPSPESEAWLVVREAPGKSEFRVAALLDATNRYVAVQFTMQPDRATLKLDSLRVMPYGAISDVQTLPDTLSLRFILDQRYRYEPRGFVYSLTFPTSFRSTSGAPMTLGSGNTVAWYYSPESSDSTVAFPQPWSRQRDAEIRFSHVRLGATVIVTTLAGVEIARIPCTDPAGGVRWTPRAPDGSLLPEGIYLYFVRTPDGDQTAVQKLVVVP